MSLYLYSYAIVSQKLVFLYFVCICVKNICFTPRCLGVQIQEHWNISFLALIQFVTISSCVETVLITRLTFGSKSNILWMSEKIFLMIVYCVCLWREYKHFDCYPVANKQGSIKRNILFWKKPLCFSQLYIVQCDYFL